MRFTFFFLIINCLYFQLHAEDVMLLSAMKDQQVEVYKLHPKTGLPKLDHSLKLPAGCGELALSADGSKIYVALTFWDRKLTHRYGIATLQFNSEGKLSLLHIEKKATGVTHMAAEPTGKYLISASYGDGKVSMHPVSEGICKGPLAELRSTDDNAHCVAISKDGRYAFVPHTGPNAVYQFRINLEKKRLDANDPAYVKGPKNDANQHEPRHIRFHPHKNFAYTSNERGGGISFWKYDPFFGRLTLTQTESTTDHSNDVLTGFASADIRLSPNGRFAYVTNRDNRDIKNPEGLDSISAFQLHPSQGRIIKRIGIYPTGRHPRVMTLDKKGNFLYCGGKNSNDLFTYKVESDGSLSLIQSIQVGQAPMGIMIYSQNK